MKDLLLRACAPVKFFFNCIVVHTLYLAYCKMPSTTSKKKLVDKDESVMYVLYVL